MKFVIIYIPQHSDRLSLEILQPFTEEEVAAALERKIAALDLMEAEWRSENDPQSLASSSLYSLTYSSWLSYGASLVTNIVQNIQVTMVEVNLA